MQKHIHLFHDKVVNLSVQQAGITFNSLGIKTKLCFFLEHKIDAQNMFRWAEK